MPQRRMFKRPSYAHQPEWARAVALAEADAKRARRRARRRLDATGYGRLLRKQMALSFRIAQAWDPVAWNEP